MIHASRPFNRTALHSAFCLSLLATAAGSLAAQTPATPPPAQSTPVPAQAAPTPAPAAAPQAEAPKAPATLTVKVKGIRNAKGKMDVALYGKEDGFPLDPSSAVAAKQVDIDPQTLTVTVVFTNLPAGVYAATVMHDENMAGKMEFDGQGIPMEGFGISNNPDVSSGPPSWDGSKFTVSAPDSAIEISMIYMQ